MVIICAKPPEIMRRGISYYVHASPAFFLLPALTYQTNGAGAQSDTEQSIDEFLNAAVSHRPKEVLVAGWLVHAVGTPSPWTNRALVAMLRKALVEGPVAFTGQTVYNLPPVSPRKTLADQIRKVVSGLFPAR